MFDSSRWENLIKVPMGGLNALSVADGNFITYSRSCDSYELLVTNFLDDSGTAWLDFYVEDGKSVDVLAVHPRDGLAANGIDWDEREDDFGDEIHLVVGDESKDQDGEPFAVVTLPREVAVKLVQDIVEVLQITEKKGNS